MIKQDYSNDKDIKILDIENVKYKRNQFFEPSSRKTIHISDLKINIRKNQRNETFAKKRKIQLKFLIKEGNHLNKDRIEV